MESQQIELFAETRGFVRELVQELTKAKVDFEAENKPEDLLHRLKDTRVLDDLEIHQEALLLKLKTYLKTSPAHLLESCDEDTGECLESPPRLDVKALGSLKTRLETELEETRSTKARFEKAAEGLVRSLQKFKEAPETILKKAEGIIQAGQAKEEKPTAPLVFNQTSPNFRTEMRRLMDAALNPELVNETAKCPDPPPPGGSFVISQLSPWQLSDIEPFFHNEAHGNGVCGLCFAMPGYGKTALMLEIATRAVLQAVDHKQETRVLILVHNEAQVHLFREQWGTLKTPNRDALDKRFEVNGKQTGKLHKKNDQGNKGDVFSWRFQRDAADVAHILVICFEKPYDVSMGEAKTHRYHSTSDRYLDPKFTFVLVDEVHKHGTVAGSGQSQGYGTYERTVAHAAPSAIKKVLRELKGFQEKPAFRCIFFSGTPLANGKSFCRFLGDILATLTWRRREQVQKFIRDRFEQLRLEEKEPVKLRELKQVEELLLAIWSDPEFHSTSHPKAEPEDKGPKAGKPKKAKSSDPKQNEQRNNELLLKFFFVNAEPAESKDPAEVVKKWIAEPTVITKRLTQKTAVSGATVRRQLLMDLLIAGNLLVLHKVISSPKVMQISGHAWQSGPATRHDFVPKLDSQKGPERRIECFEFQDSTYKPPEDLGTLRMVAPNELAAKGLLLPGPEQLSTSGVIVLCTPPSWAHEKVSSLRKKVDGKKPQYPPQYRALDFIVQNNRSVRHFAIFPDKQNNGAPDLFEWLLTHRASDYIGFAFSGPYLDLEKELSNLAEKAKVAADRTTKAVKALPEELALLQGKAQERATSIDNQLKEIRVLTIENLNDEGTKLPKLSGKASVEEGLEILEKCLKKIRGLELELFIQAWGDSRDSTKTRVKTAVFPLFPQDAKDKDASQIYSKMSDLFNKLPDSKSARDWPALIIGDPKCQEGLSLHVLASHIMCPALIKQSGARGRRFCFSPGKTSTLFLYVEAPSAKSGKKGKKDCVAERNEWGKLALQLQEQRNQGSVVELIGLMLSDLSVECSLLSPNASHCVWEGSKSHQISLDPSPRPPCFRALLGRDAYVWLSQDAKVCDPNLEYSGDPQILITEFEVALLYLLEKLTTVAGGVLLRVIDAYWRHCGRRVKIPEIDFIHQTDNVTTVVWKLLCPLAPPPSEKSPALKVKARTGKSHLSLRNLVTLAADKPLSSELEYLKQYLRDSVAKAQVRGNKRIQKALEFINQRLQAMEKFVDLQSFQQKTKSSALTLVEKQFEKCKLVLAEAPEAEVLLARRQRLAELERIVASSFAKRVKNMKSQELEGVKMPVTPPAEVPEPSRKQRKADHMSAHRQAERGMGIRWPSLDLKRGEFRFGEPELVAKPKPNPDRAEGPSFKEEGAERKPPRPEEKTKERQPDEPDQAEAKLLQRQDESPTTLALRDGQGHKQQESARNSSKKPTRLFRDNLALIDGQLDDSSRKQRLALALQEDAGSASWQSANAHGINCRVKESCESRKKALAALFKDVHVHGSAALKERLEEFNVLENCSVDQPLNERWRRRCRIALSRALHPDSLGKAGTKFKPHRAEMDKAWHDLFDCGLECRPTGAPSVQGETQPQMEEDRRLKAVPEG